ncbi:MAG: hypothetical protein M9894_34840 [Planctomycetes bacterium]|nr:hypothetical protein [Planctomycetota bacterium]
MTEATPLPGGQRGASDRRIAAGDWVRLASLDPSLPGIGKVEDGDYDPRDGALRAARVDLAGREYWITPAELARVLPEEEALLVARALERGLVDRERDPARAARLEQALGALRADRASYVRSPGLLDVLWVFTSRHDPDHGSAPLTALFDEAAALLVERRLADASGPLPPPRWDELMARVTAPPVERAPARVVVDPVEPAPPDEVLARVLRTLNHLPLEEIARAHGCAVPRRRDGIAALRRAVEKAVPLDGVLAHLTLTQLRLACCAVGLAGELPGDADALRARLLAAARRPAPPSSPPAPPPTGRLAAAPRRAAMPTPPEEVPSKVLITLDARSLVGVAQALSLPVPPLEQGGMALLRSSIEAAAPLPTILALCTPHQLRLACRMVGLLGDLPDDPDALRSLLLAAATPPTDDPVGDPPGA